MVWNWSDMLLLKEKMNNLRVAEYIYEEICKR